MTIKIVAFGEPEQVSKLIEKSRGGHSLQSEEAVTVETVTVAETQFLLFAVRERGLVSEQATGTNGLIFFLGAETPLFEEKQYLTDLLSSKPEFDAVPLAVIFERGHQLTLKDVVNYLELFRLKERASLIKEVSWGEKEWLEEVYGWVKTQAENSKARGFTAVPKVVKLKPKYRESVEEESEKKYEGMLGEKDVRALGVKQQQEVYIDREKEKLKHENMENQLSNFSKNKKKMAPYDIKPTPNPKIEPNLHFFLKDPNAQPPPEVSIKIQTDEFKERPAPPAYKPKKTGINTATQIEQNELFNFDKEVKPILAILTTKALQTAALEIEEEEELLKMAKYRSAYEERVKKQREHEQRNIEEEMRVMKEKDKLLEAHRARAQTVRNVQYRTQCYQIANSFLQNIYYESVSKLVTANAYPDPLANFLATDYLAEIIAKAAAHQQRLQAEQTSLQGVFEKDVVGGLTEAVRGPKAAREVTRRRVEARLTNKSASERRVHVLYRHDAPQFSNFSKYLGRYFDGSLEEYVKSREEQIQEVADRVHGGEASEEELHRAKGRDSAEFAASGHQAFLLGNQRELCFTWTSNRYERINDNFLSAGLLCLDKEGEMVDQLLFGKLPDKFAGFARRESGLRSARETVNMDEGLAINLAKVPENIKAILLVGRFAEAQRLRGEAEGKRARHASYGAEFWERKVAIHQRNIGEAIKWEEVVKAGEGEEAVPQSVLVVGYLLRRRVVGEWWSLEDVAHVCQPVKSEEDLDHLLEDLSRCYYRSWEFLKEEEEEERIERPPSSQEKKSASNTRVKSKKVIEEPKKKIVLKVATKILSEVQIDLTAPFETAVKKLAESIEEWKEFLETCDNGWELWMKGKKLTSVEQLAEFRKVGDLVLRKVPKPEEPKVEKVAEAEGEKEEADE